MVSGPVQVHNDGGSKRVVVTKTLPGERWLDILTDADCRVEVCTHPDTILSVDIISQLIGDKCHGVVGQLTERWDKELFGKLKQAGGSAFSNYAVGYNNVNVKDATAQGIPVGNTPGTSTACCSVAVCVVATLSSGQHCDQHNALSAAWYHSKRRMRHASARSCVTTRDAVRRRADGDDGRDRVRAHARGGAPRRGGRRLHARRQVRGLAAHPLCGAAAAEQDGGDHRRGAHWRRVRAHDGRGAQDGPSLL